MRGAAALGYFIGAVAPNMDVANAALPAYVTVLLFFVGLLLRNQDQPVYWRWFSYLDFLKYAWGAQMINQFEGSKAIVFDFQTVRGLPVCLRSCCSRDMQSESRHNVQLQLACMPELLWPCVASCQQALAFNM